MKLRSLRSYLVAIVVVVALPLLVFAVGISVQAAYQQRHLLETGLLDTTQALAVAVEKEIETSSAALTALAASEHLDTGDLGAFLALASRVRSGRSAWYGVWLSAPGGQVLAMDIVPAGTALPSIADRDYFVDVIRTGRPAVSSLVAGRVTPGYHIAVAVPVMRDGRVKYVLAAGVRPELFGQVIQPLLDPDAVAAIVDRNFVLLSRTREPERWIGRRATTEYIETISRSKEGVARSVAVDGRAVYTGFRRLEPIGWTVGVGVPAARLESALWRAVGFVALIGTTLLTVAVLGAVLVSRRIVRPIQAAARSARTVVEGGQPTLSPTAVAEIGDLNGALRDAARLIREREEARHALDRERAQAEATFAMVVEASPVANMLVNVDGGIVMTNPAAEKLFRYDRRELVGLSVDALLPVRLQDAHRSHRAEYWKAPTARQLGAGRDLYARAKNGSLVPVEIGLVPIEAHGKRFVLASIVDIAERRRAETERAALLARTEHALAQAEASNRAKEQFLAMLGHELRNPLAAIRTAVHVLGQPGERSELAEQSRAVIARQTELMVGLVDDLLDVARFATGGVVLKREHVNMAGVVRHAIDALQAQGGRPRANVVVTADEVWVAGDAVRLEQIVTNLVSNAVRYTPGDGAITIDVRANGAWAVLTVADTGVGIAPSFMPYLFEPFRQGTDQPLDRRQGGLGLGLTIVKRLVELHGGTIGATSSGVGRGSVFTVRLPLEQAPVFPVEAEAPSRPIARSCRIAVVEDNADARDMLVAMLQVSGHIVRSAEDGHDGLRLIVDWRPDVALVDIGLPGLDGYEIAQRARASDPAARLVALTGYGQPEDRRRAIEAGFDTHLVKPVHPDTLLSLIADVCAADEGSAGD